ncbi:MAG: IclR family transcriptional regulator [Salinibacterium sp.]|nr:IclR family transcriptional regulator [Salinibacterium sp.]MBF0672524.1 IclR family transcriptional regulator [Salinibacterium sp.]
MARLTPAVVRTLDILELFLDADGPLTAPEVVRRTGVPRTTAHELLSTLVARDYLQKDDGGGFRLGVRLLHLGNAYSARFDMLAAANEAARELSARTNETVSVALREGADVFYLAKVEPRDTLRLPSSIGQRLPANVTGLGKVLLAYVSPTTLRELFPDADALPRMTERSIRSLDALEQELEGVRETGVAFEREESTPGVWCVAAPVRDSSGAVVAAISLSVPSARFSERPDSDWADLVRAAGDGLSSSLGYALP